MLEAVILAGGKGLRLKGQTDIPKPFLIIDPESGETLLDSQLKWLEAYGFEHIILTLSRPTFKYARSNYPKLLDISAIDITIEEEPVGTAGALKRAFPYIEEKQFYCMNVDDIVDYNPESLYHAAGSSNAILIQEAKLPFGVVHVTPEMEVLHFEEKPVIPYYVSCGHYVFNKKLVADFLQDEGDLERSMLEQLAKARLLRAHRLTSMWLTINTMKDLLVAQERIRKL